MTQTNSNFTLIQNIFIKGKKSKSNKKESG